MKKMCFAVVFLFSFVRLIAQENNLYNQIGLDYGKSLELIENDYSSGKVKDFDESMLKYYSEAVPLKNEISVELASNIVSTLNSSDLNYANIVRGSKLSDFAKQVYLDLIRVPEQMSDSSYKEHLILKVEEILKSNIDNAEKEFVLSQVSITYNLVGTARGRGCFISTPNYEGPASGEPCIIMGALLGCLIGWSICGFWCALGGAIVGGVLGSLS